MPINYFPKYVPRDERPEEITGPNFFQMQMGGTLI